MTHTPQSLNHDPILGSILMNHDYIGSLWQCQMSQKLRCSWFIIEKSSNLSRKVKNNFQSKKGGEK